MMDGWQVEKLRWICLQQLVSDISKETVLEYAAVADAVTDSQLLDACMQFILHTENRYGMPAVIPVQELGVAHMLIKKTLGSPAAWLCMMTEQPGDTHTCCMTEQSRDI